MKKFFYYSISISLPVISLCVLLMTVNDIVPFRRTFNVNIDGHRSGVGYSIKTNLPEDEVIPYVRNTTEQLKNR